MKINNKFFESKNYPVIMFLLIIITSLLIIFNFANIINPDKTINEKITDTTTLTILEDSTIK